MYITCISHVSRVSYHPESRLVNQLNIIKVQHLLIKSIHGLVLFLRPLPMLYVVAVDTLKHFVLGENLKMKGWGRHPRLKHIWFGSQMRGVGSNVAV
jgi:hypothetical protein